MNVRLAALGCLRAVVCAVVFGGAPGCTATVDDKPDSAGETGVDSAVPDSGEDSGPADSGETGGDSGDSGGDSGDTGTLKSGVTSWDSTAGLPLANWYGLSVALDGTVWGATSAGLVHFDPVAGNTHTYLRVDGLYTDYPRAVLAASDGTIWVGHVGDTTRQGEQLQLEDSGALTILRIIDFTESEEISQVYRLREQPYGVGVGDIWMGTNEGACLFDADLAVFQEHAHPTHPHDISYGLAFSSDGDLWNGDKYQLSRWHYSNDGDLSPSADLAEFWVPWPVSVKEPIGTTDLDMEVDPVQPEGTLGTLWITSSTMGVARVTVASGIGGSTTTDLGAPFPSTASAVRYDGDGHVWVGTSSGVYVWDVEAETMAYHDADWLPNGTIQQLALDVNTSPPTMWLATPYALVRVVGVPE